MALHLLLFTSDAQIALTLGKLLSEFNIEVEFCSEALASVEKVTRDNFDAIVVDWDDGPEATFLLKTARELKSTRECLALALVSDAAAGACAVQIGAHGILNKPIVPEQIRENMRTIHEMMLSRQNSAKPAAQLSQPAFSALPGSQPLREEAPPEADQKDEAPQEAPKRTPDPKLRFLAREPRDLPPLPPMPKGLEPSPREASIGTIFSSTPYRSEIRETKVATDKKGKTGTRIVVMAGVLLMGALFYVWAPGSSYFERLTTLTKSFLGRSEPQKIVVEAKPSPSTPPSPLTTKSTNIDVVASPTGEPPVPTPDASSPDESAGNIQVTPVLEPTDINTGAPRPATPLAPVVPSRTEENQPAAVVPEPVPAVQPPAVAPQPTTIAAVEHPRVEVPQSLRFSNPINPVQTAASATPPVQAGGSSLTATVVPEETMRDLLVKKIQPAYPDQALKAGVQGAVVLQAWIARDGSIRDVKLVRGPFVLAKAAVDAVRQWQYKPYSVNGQVLEVQTQITVNFKIPTAGPTVSLPSPHQLSVAGSDASKQ